MNQETQIKICQFIREAGQKTIHLRELGFQVDEKGFDDYVSVTVSNHLFFRVQSFQLVYHSFR